MKSRLATEEELVKFHEELNKHGYEFELELFKKNTVGLVIELGFIDVLMANYISPFNEHIIAIPTQPKYAYMYDGRVDYMDVKEAIAFFALHPKVNSLIDSYPEEKRTEIAHKIMNGELDILFQIDEKLNDILKETSLEEE